jgi:hypothetical protein
MFCNLCKIFEKCIIKNKEKTEVKNIKNPTEKIKEEISIYSSEYENATTTSSSEYYDNFEENYEDRKLNF